MRRLAFSSRRPANRWLAVVCCWLACSGGAAAETWADRLGFPADSRVLILHAGELGLSHETNAAAANLLKSGAVNAAAAIVPAPWFADAAKWSQAHPAASVGLELALNSELENYRWQPVASEDYVPSLVDADGFLWQRPVQTASNAVAADVERELLAQIARAKTAGLKPSHLTSHLGTLFERPDFVDAYLRVARQQWIPAAIVELTDEQLDRFSQAGNPVPEDVVAALDEYPLPKLDALRFVPDADSYEAKKQALLALIRDLPPGLTQIELRPASASDALPHMVDDAQQRIWDAQMLADAEVLEALRAEGIVTTNWREVMRRFAGARPPKAATPSATEPQPQ